MTDEQLAMSYATEYALEWKKLDVQDPVAYPAFWVKWNKIEELMDDHVYDLFVTYHMHMLE